MLHYLFHIIITVENEEAKNIYEGSYLANYPYDTKLELIEINAKHLTDMFTNICNDDFCIQFCCTDANTQIDLDIYTLTEEQYNFYKETCEEVSFD